MPVKIPFFFFHVKWSVWDLRDLELSHMGTAPEALESPQLADACYRPTSQNYAFSCHGYAMEPRETIPGVWTAGRSSGEVVYRPSIDCPIADT